MHDVHISLWIQSVKFEWEDGYHARCLEIPKNVSFNIVSEASYVYFLSRQKLIKNAKHGPFWRVFKPDACGQIVLPDRSTFIR